MKAVLIDGSPARNSGVAALLQAIHEQLANAGHEVSIVSLCEQRLPINDPMYYHNPEEHPEEDVRTFVSIVQGADVIVLGTPLYHGSFSGLIKMALDHLDSHALAGKTVGIVSNATAPRGSLTAAQELVHVARNLKGNVINRLIGTSKEDYTLQDGVLRLTEPSVVRRTALFTSELISS